MASEPRPRSWSERPGAEASGTAHEHAVSPPGHGAPIVSSEEGPDTGFWNFDADEPAETFPVDGYVEAAAGPGWEEGSVWAGAYPGLAGAQEPNWDSGQEVGWAEGEAGGYSDGYYQAGYNQATYAEPTYGRAEPGAGQFEQLGRKNYGYAPTAPGQRTWRKGAPPPPRRPPPRTSGPWPELVMIAAVAVIIAAVILAVTDANRTNHSTSAGNVTAPTAAAGGANKSRTTSQTPTTSGSRPTATRPTTSTSPPPSSKAQNLLVSLSVKASLIKSWLATNPGGVGLLAKDVAGTVPGQVYYGVQAGPPRVYWAIAAFEPSPTVLSERATSAGQAELAQFQNSDYIFTWKSGAYWTELGYVSEGECPGTYVPPQVLAVWGLCGA